MHSGPETGRRGGEGGKGEKCGYVRYVSMEVDVVSAGLGERLVRDRDIFRYERHVDAHMADI